MKINLLIKVISTQRDNHQNQTLLCLTKSVQVLHEWKQIIRINHSWSASWDGAEGWFLSLQIPRVFYSHFMHLTSHIFMHIHEYFRKNKRLGRLVCFLASTPCSEITILWFPPVNLLSRPKFRTKSKFSVQSFPSLLADLVNSQLPCQQILSSNFLCLRRSFSIICTI